MISIIEADLYKFLKKAERKNKYTYKKSQQFTEVDSEAKYTLIST